MRVGGDGYARRLRVRETEEGDERGRVRGGSRAVRGGVGDVQAMRGKQEEARRSWRSSAVCSPRSCLTFWQKVEERRCAGWAAQCWAG